MPLSGVTARIGHPLLPAAHRPVDDLPLDEGLLLVGAPAAATLGSTSCLLTRQSDLDMMLPIDATLPACGRRSPHRRKWGNHLV